MKKINQIVASMVIPMLLSSPFNFSAYGQQSYSYRFASTPITSQPPGGPVLEPIGSPITPVSVTIPATTCGDMPTIDLTYFPHNSGFKAKSFFTGQYSIEMIFRFSELNGFNRVIDFSNSQSDHGIYTFYDCLNFFPTGDIGPCPAFDTTNYIQFVIIRNQATKQMNIYVNGELFTNYLDDTDYYVIGAAPNDSIKFFKDDLAFGNEASPGHVALIRMCDFELSPQQIADSYNDFCLRITATQESTNLYDIAAYPNPAHDQITFQYINPDFSKEINLSMTNTIGQVLLQIPIKSEWTNIEVGHLLPGVYFYQMHADQKVVKSGKIIVE